VTARVRLSVDLICGKDYGDDLDGLDAFFETVGARMFADWLKRHFGAIEEVKVTVDSVGVVDSPWWQEAQP
jgi:hypothetical protein